MWRPLIFRACLQVGDFTDTMLIPQISIGAGSVQMRFQPGPFSGYAVMHW